MVKRFFHFSYLEPQKQHARRLHALRDGDAFAELALALSEQDLTYGELILNHPLSARQPNLDSSDLLVLTTRPPLHDDPFDRRFIKRSETPLEKAILNAIGPCFGACRRSYLKLSEDMARELKYPNRGEIEFRTYRGAHYKRFRTPYTQSKTDHKWEIPPTPMATAVFLLLMRLWDDGPMLLNAYGMDGTSTLIWCYLLRTVYQRMLNVETPRFVMAEIITAPIPDSAATLEFAKQWNVELLLDHPLQ